jgi:uncharacterized protein YihD (DUF1040 family)
LEALALFDIDLNKYTEHEFLQKVPIEYSSTKDYLGKLDEYTDEKLVSKLKMASFDTSVYINRYAKHVSTIIS